MLIAWIFFRSESLADATTFVGNLAVGRLAAARAWMVASLVFLAPLVAMHVWAWLD